MPPASVRLRTLVLNADYRPLSSTSAMRGLRLVESKLATALETSKVTVCSERLALPIPSVIVLAQYIKSTRAADRVAHPTRTSIFFRDHSDCQYCGAAATTLDHVVPRSRGGTTTWTNVVACCMPCNQKKGNKLLSQTSLKLRSLPAAAHWSTAAVAISHAPQAFVEQWSKYIV